MVTIGIFSDNGHDMLEIINGALKESGINFLSAETETASELSDAFMEAVKKKASVLILNVESALEKVTSLKFDILIFMLKTEKEKLGLGNHLKRKSYLILDCDKPLPKEIYTHSDTTFITCGFSRCASMTVSSVNVPFGGSILCCLQRELLNIKGEKIEPVEIAVDTIGAGATEAMAAITAAMVSGANV
ncbi:MAG: hypothetical protein HFE62_02940 [Firmicutes bacterium]|nr:hypothetical protein [Bacillota bacterium]